MLGLYPSLQIFLCQSAVDMRLGFNGLEAKVREGWNLSPTSGNLFVFVNKRKNRMKILLWEKGGFWLLCKRLEKGVFPIPNSVHTTGPLEVGYTDLLLIIDGLEVITSRRSDRFFPVENS